MSNIKLGFISGLTGVYGWMAEDQLRGVQMAVEEINKDGGVAGHNVEIVVKDDESKPKLSTQKTRELIRKDKVDFVIGSLSAGTHLFINKETEDARKIFMSIGQSNEITEAPHLGPLTFHEAWTPHISAQAMGTWVYKNLGKKWLLLLADYQWGWHIEDAYNRLAKSLGADIIGTIKVAFPAPSEAAFEAHFKHIRDEKPEVLVACNYGLDQVKFMNAAGKAHLNHEMSIVNTISEFPIVKHLDPEVSAGMYWGGNYYWKLSEELPKAKVFFEDYMYMHNEIPSGYSAYGYSGGMELLGAAQRLDEYPIQSENIAQSLEGQTYAHYKNGQWWRPCDHQSFHDQYVMKMKGPEEREDENDVSEILGSTSWSLHLARSCKELGHADKQWGHFHNKKKKGQ